jgi:hypothetical protein
VAADSAPADRMAYAIGVVQTAQRAHEPFIVTFEPSWSSCRSRRPVLVTN